MFFFNVSNLPAGSDPVGLVLELVGPQLEEMLENQEWEIVMQNKEKERKKHYKKMRNNWRE